MYKTYSQITAKQIDQLEELSKQTGAGPPELVRRAVDYYLHEFRELGLQPSLRPSPTGESTKGP